MAFYNPSTSLGNLNIAYITQPTVFFKNLIIAHLFLKVWRDFDHQNLQGASESCDLIQMFKQNATTGIHHPTTPII